MGEAKWHRLLRCLCCDDTRLFQSLAATVCLKDRIERLRTASPQFASVPVVPGESESASSYVSYCFGWYYINSSKVAPVAQAMKQISTGMAATQRLEIIRKAVESAVPESVSDDSKVTAGGGAQEVAQAALSYVKLLTEWLAWVFVVDDELQYFELSVAQAVAADGRGLCACRSNRRMC